MMRAMGELAEFAKRVHEQMTCTSREPHWEPGEAARYMAEVEVRRESFAQIAMRLVGTVIQPRLETLASYFPNASPTKDEPASRCSNWFGYCERFPASTKVSFAVEHDVAFEKVAVCYEASMMPAFIKLNERDKLILPLDKLKDDVVADWVEERLLEFLQAYLQIDRGSEEFDEDAATDPVCGMRISRSQAVSSHDHNGHPYFFCSRECQESFKRQPTAYIDVT